MGILFKQYLSGDRIYTCSQCKTHCTDHGQLISKAFQGRHGRAYLFSDVVNVTLGPREDRMLITGLHTVCDIYCITCNCVLGWKYEVRGRRRETKECTFAVFWQHVGTSAPSPPP